MVGIKSREVYETPAAICLIEAHSDLEKMVHTKHETKFKTLVDDEWAWMVYSGLWDDPLRQELDQFIEQAQKRVTGTVKLKLHKGNVRVEIPFGHTLYAKTIAEIRDVLGPYRPE